MREYYNGFKFSRNDDAIKVYNSTMCLYFLDNYVNLNEIPYDMADVNVESDYTKVGR